MLAALVVAGAPAGNGDTLRIRGVTYLGDLPTLVADERGLFDGAGVAARVEYGLSGKLNLQRLREGRSDFSLMALTPLVVDLIRDPTPGGGDDPVVLASLVHSTHFDQVVALESAGFDTPGDLRGRRIGLSKGTNAAVVWWLFCAYHGIDPATVRIVDQPVQSLGESLLEGSIDAAVLWEPWTMRLRARADSGIRVFPGSDLYTAKWVLVARRRTLEERPDEVRNVLLAYGKAIDFIERRPEEALRLYVEHAGVSEDSVRDLADRLVFEINLDWSLIAALQQEIDWARRAGYGEGDGDGAGVLSIIEPGPLRSVAPNAVGIPVNSAWTGSEAN